MRIGILTLPLNANYGGLLQAYALQTVLERMGNEVVVFNRPLELDKVSLWKKPITYSKRIIKKYLLKQPILIFSEKPAYEREVIGRKYTQKFVDTYIHQYLIRHISDINAKDVDAIVVGSDQIWRMLYFKSMWDDKKAADAFLQFTKGWNIKRVSYAASFGLDYPELSKKEVITCKDALGHFDGISVREESGASICEKYFNIKAQWVLDPTMLLNATDYSNIFKEGNNPKEHILMSYILDETPEIAKLRENIARAKGLRIKKANVSQRLDQKEKFQPQPPLEDWLKAFDEAEYVINDSFHACVFSILFHKQFTVIGNKTRGMSRFQSLLKMFGLEDRLITDPKEYRELSDIDYNRVDLIVCGKSKESLSFLRKALGI